MLAVKFEASMTLHSFLISINVNLAQTTTVGAKNKFPFCLGIASEKVKWLEAIAAAAVNCSKNQAWDITQSNL